MPLDTKRSGVAKQTDRTRETEKKTELDREPSRHRESERDREDKSARGTEKNERQTEQQCVTKLVLDKQ